MNKLNLTLARIKSLFWLGLVFYCLIFLCCWRLTLVQDLKLAWKDLLFTLVQPKSLFLDKVVVVAIDEPSFQEIGLQWPWPRSLHARLIQQLKKAGAEAIVFDVLFVEPSLNKVEDLMLAQAIKQAKNVVFGLAYSKIERSDYIQEIMVEPLPLFLQTGVTTGVVNFFPDSDGIIRKGKVKINNHLSLAAASLTFSRRQEKGVCSDPFYIQFSSPRSDLTTVSYYQALDPNKYLTPNVFKNKIVFVGLASEAAVEVQRSAVDAFPTPYFRFSKKLMFGVKIHANAAMTMLAGCPLRQLPNATGASFIFGLVLITCGYFLRKNIYYLILSTVGGILLFGGVSLELFVNNLFFTPEAALIGFIFTQLNWGAAEFILNIREKQFLTKAFSLYVSKYVVSELVKDPDKLKLGGEQKEISILFADIRNFTRFSEQVNPETLVFLLNNYLSQLTKHIFNYQGTLDKYIGDAIMAIFGAPLDHPQHGVLACQVALAMQKTVKDIAPLWQKYGMDRFAIGIGINTGWAVVGNLGSQQRFDYTAVGDTVNLASRLEGLTKLYQVPILVSHFTVLHCQKHGVNFYFRELDTVIVKGKQEGVKIFSLEEHPCLALEEDYSRCLDYYRRGEFLQAIALAKKILQRFPNDTPTQLLKKRSEYLLINPPKSWNGIWQIQNK